MFRCDIGTVELPAALEEEEYGDRYSEEEGEEMIEEEVEVVRETEEEMANRLAKLDEMRNINPLDVLNYKYLIIDNPAAAFKFLEAKMK